ncbi:unnamed protein product [Paramecium primaurelia]|uniref:Uncharacterized protein n=1 Tax=Paramecium primaurelia TaxID=5886 RepID=A0A8S1QBQ5_PARPR|nr:unnamed protein product [Paramecium primaurelia]
MFQQYKLIIFSLIIQSVFAVQNDTKTILVEFDANNFGNTILSTVRMFLQSKGNAEEILVLLNQVLAGLVDDQINMTIFQNLENSIAYHTAQVAANAQMREDNEKALAEIETETDVRQTIQVIIIQNHIKFRYIILVILNILQQVQSNQLQYNKKDIESNERIFAQEETNRNKAHKTWVKKNGEYDVNETTNQLVQYLSLDAKFAELKPKFEALQMRLIYGALFQPIVTAQNGLATKVDQKAIQRIIQLLSQFRYKQQELDLYWKILKIDKKESIRISNFKHSSLILILPHFYEVHTLELEQTQQTLDAEHEWCDLLENTYYAQSSERTRQLGIVERILEQFVLEINSNILIL